MQYQKKITPAGFPVFCLLKEELKELDKTADPWSSNCPDRFLNIGQYDKERKKVFLMKLPDNSTVCSELEGVFRFSSSSLIKKNKTFCLNEL